MVAAAVAFPLLRIVKVALTEPPGVPVTDVGVTVGTSRSGAPADPTVTLIRCEAVSPPGSRAVTVIVALPVLPAVTVTLEPDTEARATLEFDEVAVYVSASLSGSLKYREASIVVLPPGASVCAGIVPTRRGARSLSANAIETRREKMLRVGRGREIARWDEEKE